MATRISDFVPNVGRIMVTDGGPHPAGAWAQVTAQHIAPIAPDMTGARYVAATRLQLAIADALEPHHSVVQAAERAALDAVGHAHLSTPLDPEPHLDDALRAIVAAAKGTEWEAHFGDPAVLAAIRHELAVHFRSSMHVERSWHVDRHQATSPGDPHIAAWIAAHRAPTPATEG